MDLKQTLADALSEKENYLKTVELSTEQNANMIDGIPNNESPRICHGYTILESETVGCMEYVIAENQKAPSPYAVWVRNMAEDEKAGQENFFWGHYFSTPGAAKEDFQTRADSERERYFDKRERPSLLEDLKRHKETAANAMRETVTAEKAGKVNER